jgi:uncharacterized protein YjiS (DUF1127 family)
LFDRLHHVLKGAVERCSRGLSHWQQRRRDRRTLMRLDERALRDLGLDRPPVESDNITTFWRPP